MDILPRERRIEALLDQRFEWTARQKEVLDLIARGKTNQEVADTLGISLDGAKWHMREILSKLGVDSREEAAEYWRRRNGWRGRLGRAARAAVPLPLGKWAVAVAGVTVVGLAAAALAVSLQRGDSDLQGGGPKAGATTQDDTLADWIHGLDAEDITRASVNEGGPCCTEWANSTVSTGDQAGRAVIERLVERVEAATPLGPEPPGGQPDLFAVVVEGSESFSLAPAYRCRTYGSGDFESFTCDEVPGNVLLHYRGGDHELHSWELYEWLRVGYQQDFPRVPVPAVTP